jgi:hypothetical protein
MNKIVTATVLSSMVLLAACKPEPAAPSQKTTQA